MKQLVPKLKTQEAAALIGLLLVFVGLALWYVPAALVVVGGLVLAYVFLPDQSGEGAP